MRLIPVFILLLLLPIVSLLAEDVASTPVRISLSVNGDEGIGSLGQIITSYLSREFRSIPGVEISEDQPILTVHVVALTNKDQAGRSTGYTVSTVTLLHCPQKWISDLSAHQVSPDVLSAFTVASKDGFFLQHYLNVMPADALPTVCKEIVAVIDGASLEGFRKPK